MKNNLFLLAFIVASILTSCKHDEYLNVSPSNLPQDDDTTHWCRALEVPAEARFKYAKEHQMAPKLQQDNLLPITGMSKAVGVWCTVSYSEWLYYSSSDSAAASYIKNSLFKNVERLYAASNMAVYLAGIDYIHSPDSVTILPRDIGSTLINYGAYVKRNTSKIGGDAHILIDNTVSGGIAWIEGLCVGVEYSCGVIGITNQSVDYPTYSWTLEVFCHELAHILGMHHSHDCRYGLTHDKKIDMCGDHAGYNECPNDSEPDIPDPVGGGTVSSYCHLRSVGINFLNGFGPEINEIMWNYINAHASCLKDPNHSGTGCIPIHRTRDWYWSGCSWIGYYPGGYLIQKTDSCPGVPAIWNDSLWGQYDINNVLHTYTHNPCPSSDSNLLQQILLLIDSTETDSTFNTLKLFH